MAKSKNQLVFVKYLMNYEKSLRKLYVTIAEKFPDSDNFWNDLAIEKEGHESILNSIYQKVKSGKAKIRFDQFSKKSYNKAIEMIKELYEKLSNNQIDIEGIFSYCLFIQNTMRDNKYSQFISTSEKKTKNLLTALDSGITHQIQELRKRHEEVKDVWY